MRPTQSSLLAPGLPLFSSLLLSSVSQLIILLAVGCTVNIIARKRDQMNIQANDVVKYDLLRIAGGLLSCVLHV